MIQKIIFLSSLVVGGVPTASLAQEKASLPAPTAPFVRNASANAGWTVEIEKNKNDSSSPASVGSPDKPPKAHLKKTTVQKFGSDRREIDEWSDGRVVERWFYRGYHIFQQRTTTSVFVVKPSDDAFQRLAYPDFAKGDFPDLDWLSAKTYVGEKAFKGRAGYLFEKPAEVSAGPISMPVTDKPLPKGQASSQRMARAWIDPQSRLPLAFDDGRRTRVYSYHDGSSGKAQLPPEFQAALQKYEAARTVTQSP